MKTKPTRHKNDNTFKFQPFSERIANINIDVFHRVGHKYEDASEVPGTYVHQCLQKWNVLNLSQSYEELRKEFPFVETLPQLLNKKDEVLALLLKFVQRQDPLSLQPVLELIVAFARDLHHDFYPYFGRVLQHLISILRTKDTEQLEWTFTCLAYLFKFLWRCFVRDVEVVLDSLVPLLSGAWPTYINNFAAEGFAFVARRVLDKREFLQLILETLHHRPDCVAGCGRLLFEVVRGVSGQFHSCAENVLTLYVRSLAGDNQPGECSSTVLQHVVSCVCSEVKPDKCGVLWTCIFDAMNLFVVDQRPEAVVCVLGLVHQLVGCRQGLYVCNPEALVQCLATLLGLEESIAALATETAALLLQSCYAQLSQERASFLTLKILALPHQKVVRNFFQRVFNYSGFESLVLPQLLAHCRNSVTRTPAVDMEVVRLLTRLVLHKSPPCTSGVELSQWKRYPLDFKTADSSGRSKFSFPSLLLKVIDVEDIDELLYKIDSCLCALICIPHLKYLGRKEAVKAVKNVIEISRKALKKIGEEWRSATPHGISSAPANEITNKIMFLFSTAMDALVHLEDVELLTVLHLDDVIGVLLTYATDFKYLCMLRTLDLYLSSLHVQNASLVFTARLFFELHAHLNGNLLSPYHTVRLLTLHIMSLFESPSCVFNDWSLFSVCLAAESTPATVQHYRDKLKHLDKLKYEFTQGALLRNYQFSKVPVQFLLGVLYVNFQLLWEPITKLIASYAHDTLQSQFWEVFLQQLKSSAEHVAAEVVDPPRVTSNLGWDVLDDMYSKMQEIADKPDHVNYRILLWKTLAEFSDVTESRNRDFVPLFLTYVENEYFKSNADVASLWNIKQNDGGEGNEDDESDSMDQDVEDGELTKVKQQLLVKPVLPPSRFNSCSVHKTLLAHMTIFTKIKNPRAMFREPELYKMFSDFLSHKVPDVQKMALDYLMAYKDKHVIPYQQHLYALIDDKTFKNEITMFRVESEGQVIQEDDRFAVMPIILRIVYGKMLGKSTVHSRSKARGQWRRSLVIRFLAGCREEELITFAEMTFKLFSKYIQDDPVAGVKNVASSLDLERVIPPKRLQSSVNMMHVFLEQLGSIMGQRLQPYLLRVLLCIGAFVSEILYERDQVHAGYLGHLRTLRSSCLEAVSRFFCQFEEYGWSAQEMDAVFKVFVWPWLEKLPTEGVHSPTALLKLFAAWSSNPRYFILLAKHRDGRAGCSPLPYIMELLRGRKTHASVVSFIMDMLKNLLLLEESEEQSGAPHLTVNCVILPDTEAQDKLSSWEELNVGSRLLVPHVAEVLEHLQRRLANSKRKGLGQLELVVLSRVSELVCDQESCRRLVDLLLPVLSRRAGASEHVVHDMVTSLAHLLPRVHQPEKYLRSLAPLFGTVSHVGPRKMLCKILDQIASSASPEYQEQAGLGAELVSGLNAWDPRWVEQPHFDRRLDTFKKVHALLVDDRIDAQLGTLIIHNCFYFLKKESDLSLRDSAGLCLRRVAPAVCNTFRGVAETREFLVDGTVLPLVRAGIRDRNEVVRHEAVALLGEMARECGSVHPVLRDLSRLTDKADPEVDFFENLQHLQLHRKTRALLKFCSVAAGLDRPPNPRTLTQFILPLASHFLLSDKYASKNSIIDAAIQTVGTVCRLLPWHQYETILRYYLTKLRSSVEYQKQLVRIVVAVLDAFHYDLSRAQVMEGRHGLMEMVQAHVQPKVDREDAARQTEQELVADGVAEEEELDSALEASARDDASAYAEEVEKVGKPVQLAVERQAVLARSTAGRVIHIITAGLLPQLQRCLAQRTQADKVHKVNRKHAGPDKDEEDILRVPVTLAVVKLLQRLPSYMMDNYLPGIIMKLCTFLKSHMDSVRRTTRETLQKIVVALGPSCLGMVVREMSSLLTKGFQVHVLAYTIHAVLVALKGAFKPGDVDPCLQDVLEVCKMDLFGAVSEEKDVAQIVNKTREAKSSKSYDTFSILAQHISEDCFTDLLMPLKEVLSSSFSHKTVSRVSECLRHVVSGLAENTFVSIQSIVIFMYGVVSETVPELSMEPRQPEPAAQMGKCLVERPDSFIIPPAPRSRCGAASATAGNAARTNAHVLVEFGLQLLYTLLKREKLHGSYYRVHMDPVVPILRRCLDGEHVKLVVLSLQCFRWVLKMDLPCMRMSVGKVADSLFSILHKYAVAGLSKGDNFTLVVSAFKTVTVLVRDAKYHNIRTDQLKALLLYAEQDVHDHSRRATAFSLLKAILARKLVAPEVHDVMKKVAALSITSEMAHVRQQAREVFHLFLLDYPVGKKLEHYLSFFLSQLNYELQPGRESALEMMHTVINTFPLPIVDVQSGVLFVTISVLLVNDDAPECRKMAARCIKSMLWRLHSKTCDKLFDVVLLWLEDKKASHRQLAAQLCGLFVEVEKEGFKVRLSSLVPALLDQFGGGVGGNEPGRFVRAVPVSAACGDEERVRDHLLFQVLEASIKVCEHCPSFLRHPDWREHVNQLADSAQSFLSHSHEWVRLAAAQVLGHVFSSLEPGAVAAAMVQPRRWEMDGYLMADARGKVRCLVLDLCAVLQLGDMAAELVDQVIKNLVFLGRVLKDVAENQENNAPEGSEEVEGSRMVVVDDGVELNAKVSLPWMIRQMRRVANKEVIHSPKSEVLRSAVFKWLGAVAVAVERDQLVALLPCLMPPLVRELAGEGGAQRQLYRLAKEVADVVKRQVGAEQYTLHLSRLQSRLAARRLERKKLRTQEVITDPERAAKRKIQKQLKKKHDKKKKMEILKGRKPGKRIMKRVIEIDET